jgi:uncharacterized protein (DUF362 family)
MSEDTDRKSSARLNRRTFLIGSAAGAGVVTAGMVAGYGIYASRQRRVPVFIARADRYAMDLKSVLLNALKEVQIGPSAVSGKRVLLKPNLVEPHAGVTHINTHPLMVRAAIEAFRHLGASEVMVAEGSGHRNDSYLILEETGYVDILREDRIRFYDLNRGDVFLLPNKGTHTGLPYFVLSRDLLRPDIIVSMPKMKTHHWVGATLSMKNLFGVMPGAFYGWPKNVLHFAGIENSILDINQTIQPQIAIVDGIVGMEGDGPIMGEPVHAGVVVVGRNLPVVDATCARIMGLIPERIKYLQAAGAMGPIAEDEIGQRGERISAVTRNFRLIPEIPAHQELRLAV